mmetsp:Transcript_12025/g.14309  ORF Transcript_12025/g.14309 Transcript_12025/m.14309 type:complete len:125 (+) Transcript_12025:1254-1628(+)
MSAPTKKVGRARGFFLLLLLRLVINNNQPTKQPMLGHLFIFDSGSIQLQKHQKTLHQNHHHHIRSGPLQLDSAADVLVLVRKGDSGIKQKLRSNSSCASPSFRILARSLAPTPYWLEHPPCEPL